ncbi:MAG: lipoyl(octanoyl) transferase LipB [Planctomycetes bacterium]|nr:lipoyl(octanoyl) transferase LipB [Planctomycetota bacterium]
MRFSQSAHLEVEDLGQADYLTLERHMFAVLDDVLAGGPDRLLVCEPDPVLTVGRGARIADYRSAGIPVHEVTRGGKVTFHGPGQMVIWPVIALEGEARDLHAYLHALEEAIILGLQQLGVVAGRDSRNTGAWIAKKKVASVGVAVRQWVAYHGVALNVSTDLNWFRRFDPCGLESELMTNLRVEMGQTPDSEEVQGALLGAFEQVLRHG